MLLKRLAPRDAQAIRTTGAHAKQRNGNSRLLEFAAKTGVPWRLKRETVTKQKKEQTTRGSSNSARKDKDEKGWDTYEYEDISQWQYEDIRFKSVTYENIRHKSVTLFFIASLPFMPSPFLRWWTCWYYESPTRPSFHLNITWLLLELRLVSACWALQVCIFNILANWYSTPPVGNNK